MTMISGEPVADVFRRIGIVAILRGVRSEDAVPLAETLVANGIPMLEVALTMPDALDQIGMLVASTGMEAIIGAGTVTSEALAEAALGAGAQFLVTPHVIPAVNAFGRARGVEVLGGALTPTEIAAARAQGNTFVKVFPAAPLGHEYVSALLGPYPDAELVPVGGVNVNNAEAFVRAGAVGIGVGGALTSVHGGFDKARVAAVAQALVAAVQRGRELQT